MRVHTHTHTHTHAGNMELAVDQSVNASAEITAASSHGEGLRIFQVAALQDYCNVSTPQDTLNASIPWGESIISCTHAWIRGVVWRSFT